MIPRSLYVFYNRLSRRYNKTIKNGARTAPRKGSLGMKLMLTKIEKVMEEYYRSFHQNRF